MCKSLNGLNFLKEPIEFNFELSCFSQGSLNKRSLLSGIFDDPYRRLVDLAGSPETPV